MLGRVAVSATRVGGLRLHVLGVGELVVVLLGSLSSCGDPALELVDLGLELQRPRLQGLDLLDGGGQRLARPRRPRPRPRRRPAAAAVRAFSSASGSGTTCRSGAEAASASRGTATKPAASGTASAAGHVGLTDPGRGQRRDQQPAADGGGRTLVDHRRGQRRLDLVGDGLGDLRALVAGEPARLRRDGGGQLPALPGQRAQLVAVEVGLGLAQRRARRRAPARPAVRRGVRAG